MFNCISPPFDSGEHVEVKTFWFNALETDPFPTMNLFADRDAEEVHDPVGSSTGVVRGSVSPTPTRNRFAFDSGAAAVDKTVIIRDAAGTELTRFFTGSDANMGIVETRSDFNAGIVAIERYVFTGSATGTQYVRSRVQTAADNGLTVVVGGAEAAAFLDDRSKVQEDSFGNGTIYRNDMSPRVIPRQPNSDVYKIANLNGEIKTDMHVGQLKDLRGADADFGPWTEERAAFPPGPFVRSFLWEETASIRQGVIDDDGGRWPPGTREICFGDGTTWDGTTGTPGNTTQSAQDAFSSFDEITWIGGRPTFNSELISAFQSRDNTHIRLTRADNSNEWAVFTWAPVDNYSSGFLGRARIYSTSPGLAFSRIMTAETEIDMDVGTVTAAKRWFRNAEFKGGAFQRISLPHEDAWPDGLPDLTFPANTPVSQTLDGAATSFHQIPASESATLLAPSYALRGLPMGLEFDAVNRRISGTPTAPGEHRCVLRAVAGGVHILPQAKHIEWQEEPFTITVTEG